MLKEILTSALVRDRCCRPGLVGSALDREGVVEWAIIKDKLLAKSCTPIPAIGTKIQNIVATNTANPAARKNKQLKTKQKSQWLMILFEKNNGCEWLVNCCIFALLELQRASLIQCIIAYLLLGCSDNRVISKYSLRHSHVCSGDQYKPFEPKKNPLAWK